MKQGYWQEQIEAHRAEIIDTIKNTYRSQCANDPTSGTYERVVLWDDGSITTMTDIGGNSYYQAERDGRAQCIATIGGQRPEDWEDWMAEYGSEDEAQDAILEMALAEWDWDPEQYIEDTLRNINDNDRMWRDIEAARN